MLQTPPSPAAHRRSPGRYFTRSNTDSQLASDGVRRNPPWYHQPGAHHLLLRVHVLVALITLIVHECLYTLHHMLATYCHSAFSSAHGSQICYCPANATYPL
jgi:hypothetical protein